MRLLRMLASGMSVVFICVSVSVAATPSGCLSSEAHFGPVKVPSVGSGSSNPIACDNAFHSGEAQANAQIDAKAKAWCDALHGTLSPGNPDNNGCSGYVHQYDPKTGICKIPDFQCSANFICTYCPSPYNTLPLPIKS